MRIDFEKERERLVVRYAGKTDTEMEELADVAFSLTEPAKVALRSDLTRRNLQIMIREIPELLPVHDDPNIVTVRHFRDVPAALLAKSILDSAGIECFLADINLVRLDWLWSNVIGGVWLFIKEEDVPAAQELLDQKRVDGFAVEGIGHFTQPSCRYCKSLDISFKGLKRSLAYGSIALGLPYPASHVAWYCNSCKEVWEDSPEPIETPPDAGS